MSDDDIRDKYADGWKYADVWDHLGDARAAYEKLADAYLSLLAVTAPDARDSVERIVAEMRDYLTGRYREDVDDRMGEWMARLAAIDAAIGGTP